MRTTVTIDDDLLREAKQRAAAEGRTLSDLVSEGLRERLALRDEPRRRPFRLVTSGGRGLQPGVDLSDRAALEDLLDGW
jgi:plasmid stability protein